MAASVNDAIAKNPTAAEQACCLKYMIVLRMRSTRYTACMRVTLQRRWDLQATLPLRCRCSMSPNEDRIGGATAVVSCYTERFWDGRAAQGLGCGWMDPCVVRGAVRG
jgi:hypothetical protein